MGRGTDNMIARNTSMRSGLDPAQAMRKYDRAVEHVQILVGERGPSDGSQMAVLRGDVMGGGQPADLQSTQITAAPTAADYNKLQADIAAIHSLLSAIYNTVSAKKR